MAKKPIQMRHIKEILRLKHEKELSVRLIARSCGLPASTVGDYLKRAQSASLSWPLPAELTDEELMSRLMNPEGKVEPPVQEEPQRPQPQWSMIHEELRRKGVTLRLLWEEYRREHGDGYGYSRFCRSQKGHVSIFNIPARSPIARQLGGGLGTTLTLTVFNHPVNPDARQAPSRQLNQHSFRD